MEFILSAGKNNAVANQVLSIDITKRFPYITVNKNIAVSHVKIFADSNLDSIDSLAIKAPAGPVVSIDLIQGPNFGSLLSGSHGYKPSQTAGAWQLQTSQKITSDNINDLILIFIMEQAPLLKSFIFH